MAIMDTVRAIDELRLATTPRQNEVIEATFVRFNAACEAFAAAVFPAKPASSDDLAAAVSDSLLSKFSLPPVLRSRAFAEATVALTTQAKKPRFSSFRAIHLGDDLEWTAPARVALPTVEGRWEVNVEQPRDYGWVRSPLLGRPVSMERRPNGLFLVALDVDR